MKKLLIVFILLIVSADSLYAQNRTIKGRVIDERFETVPGAVIMINDTVRIGYTDLEGFFKIEISVSMKKMLFKTVGLETASIELKDSCDEVEIVMMSGVIYDFITFKKEDKLRMKRFKKLSELHKQAFEKGLFKTDEACYTQEFVPYYKKKLK